MTVVPVDRIGNADGSTAFTRTYNNNTSVFVTAPATAPGGNNFSNWGVTDCNSITGTYTCEVIMNGPKIIRAVYASPNVSLNVVVKTAHGRVTSDSGGIDCGTTCVASYPPNTVVILTETPNANRKFWRWRGPICNEGNQTSTTCTFIVAGQTVYADFAISPGYKEF